MVKYRYLGPAASAVAVGAGAWTGQQVSQFLTTLETGPFAASLGLVIAAIGTYGVVHWFVRDIFLNWTWLRRLLLGSRFVEGKWINLLVVDNRIVSVGVIHVRACGDSVSLDGCDIGMDGVIRSTFKSRVVEMDWPHCSYLYDAERSFKDVPRSSGVGHWEFIQIAGKRFTRIKGNFVDSFDGQRNDFGGWLEENPDILIGLEDEASRLTTVREIIRDRHKASIGHLIHDVQPELETSPMNVIHPGREAETDRRHGEKNSTEMQPPDQPDEEIIP